MSQFKCDSQIYRKTFQQLLLLLLLAVIIISQQLVGKLSLGDLPFQFLATLQKEKV